MINQKEYDPIFDEYMPKQEYLIPQPLINHLLSDEGLNLYPYPEITKHSALKLLKKQYEPNIQAIDNWLIFTPYCDQKSISLIANHILGRDLSTQNDLTQALTEHKNAVETFLAKLDAYSTVINDQINAKASLQIIADIMHTIQTPPQDWQCKSLISINSAKKDE